jgi:fructose-1,6-bisphosphatase/inositol monophosphatase family enzyme
LPPNVFDPTKANVKKLEREIRNELKEMYIDKPIQAEEHAKFLFSKDTHVDWAIS